MTVQVNHTITAAAIRKGDVYAGMTVEKVVPKKVNVAVTFEGSTAENLFRKDDLIEVTRTEKTAEEIAAERAEFTTRRLMNLLTSYEEALPAAQAAMQDTFAKGYLVSDSQVQALLNAQCKAQIAATLRTMIERGLTLEEAVARKVEALTEQLVNGYNGPTYSGAFSAANAMRQADNDVAREFIRDAKSWI